MGQRLATAANAEEQIQGRGTKSQDKARHTAELKSIVQAIKRLLDRIEDAVPFINLAITASGASLSSSLPSTVSPSRLLQASTFLTAGDTQYGLLGSSAVPIGPVFTLSMYMLFQGHMRPQDEDDVRQTTWKEVIHKADVRLMRVPIDSIYDLPYFPSGQLQNVNGESSSKAIPLQGRQDEKRREIRPDEFAYQLIIVEDLDDDRVHTFEDDEAQPEPYGDIPLAGMREVVPIHQLSKIFYADTGKILNIGSDAETNSPVLLLKRDINAVPPRRMMDRWGAQELDSQNGSSLADAARNEEYSLSLISQRRVDNAQGIANGHGNPWSLPRGLDPEWMAFEVYTEQPDSDPPSPTLSPSPVSNLRPSRSPSQGPDTISSLSNLNLNSSSPSPSPRANHVTSPSASPLPFTTPAIRTSLSLLELLLRLLSLQQFQQSPHLSIPDELLTFFLSESASTGAAAHDADERKRLREEARRRVGFDPYDESPVKRRGEEYQYRSNEEYDDGDDSYGDGEYSERMQTPSKVASRGGTPVDARSRSGTPESSSQNRRPAALPRWSGLLRSDGIRKGSPLARPGSGLTDEGLGTSPSSEKRS